MENKTIVSLSTPKLNSAIAVVRLSGDKTFEIVKKIFYPHNEKINFKEKNKFYLGYIKDQKNIIDEVIILIFKSPNSFTGEDMVEINCHGSIYIIDKIINLIILNGAVQAKNGEFLYKSFINNKNNLLEVEAINNLVFSDNEISHKISINNLLGQNTNKIEKIQQKILDIIANIEVNIDYPEYDIENITIEKISEKLKIIKLEIEKIIKNSLISKKIKDGLNLIIIGKPNVGKSSLLNFLLNENKAIVSEIKGTTRDIVEGSIIYKKIKINLYDTAGIRTTKNTIEKEGINKSKDKIKEADIIVYLKSNNDNEYIKELSNINNEKIINIITKKDLLSERYNPDFNYISIINKDIKDLTKNLDKIIKNNYFINQIDIFDSERELIILKKVINKIQIILNNIKLKLGIELLSIDINEIYYELNNLLGKNIDDNILDNLFKKYCLGK